jgi:hypothetical protein
LLGYFLSGCEIVPVAATITGITFVFTFHIGSISIVGSYYFRIFSAPFLITSLSPKRLFSSPKRPDRFWGPPSPVFKRYWGSFPRVEWSGREVDHSPPTSAEVKNE